MEPFTKKATVQKGDPLGAADFLVAASGLSKTKIKDAMNKGAVWIKRSKGKLNRLRTATASLRPGDQLELYYDPELLAKKPPVAHRLADRQNYSIWLKPAGLLAQGTMYGDHCSLMRQADLFFGVQREIFLVHRLDREAAGLMVLAHSSQAAAAFSEIFRNNLIVKKYRTEVRGDLRSKAPKGTIDLPLDNKPAVTEYAVESYNENTNTSLVRVIIKTGRLHQIRRHFEMIGFPVIGDPRYGKDNKNIGGMRLEAVSLSFRCPFLRKEVEYRIPDKPE
ncbi:MAG: RNA pseudouridine synthase [Thermodesulfovibrio sp.]|nr:RNA pseudouridine synthase [Thermodesulfovibrio sp.]